MGRRRRRKYRRGQADWAQDVGRNFEDLGKELGALGLHMGARSARVAADALVAIADALVARPRPVASSEEIEVRRVDEKK